MALGSTGVYFTLMKSAAHLQRPQSQIAAVHQSAELAVKMSQEAGYVYYAQLC